MQAHLMLSWAWMLSSCAKRPGAGWALAALAEWCMAIGAATDASEEVSTAHRAGTSLRAQKSFTKGQAHFQSLD